MLPSESDKTRERNEVLNDKDFVAESSDGSEGGECDPSEEAPRGQTPVDHAVRFDLLSDVASVWPPCCQPVAEVDCCEEE